MTNNIIPFPRSNKDAPPQTMEALFEKIGEVKSSHIDYLLNEIIPSTLYFLEDEGFPVNLEENELYINFAIETLKSAILNSIGMEHPFQQLAEDVFSMSDEEIEEFKEEISC